MTTNKNSRTGIDDFNYIEPNTYYFDSACQTLRPQQVIDAENQYYKEYNACGHRVKYKWGKTVDHKVEEARDNILKLLGKSSKEYFVAFTLNTTFAINQVLSQIKSGRFNRIVTSDIEHNSVFLPSIVWAKQNNADRIILERNDDGSLDISDLRSDKDIVILNTMSNIDGRILENTKEISQSLRRTNSALFFDVAQSMGHDPSNLKDVDFDVAFGSGHKMYAPSIGFIVMKKDFLSSMDHSFIGGGTVQSVSKNDFTLVDKKEPHARFEAGLQNFAGIIGLGMAVDWLENFRYNDLNAPSYENKLNEYLYNKLEEIPNVVLFHDGPTSISSLYSEKIDSHRLAMYLASKDIMCRSGYFCCHYYLEHCKHSPPLLRISLGLHNTTEQIDYLIDNLNILLK